MSVDLGQNFLTDREVLGDIVTAAELTRDDVVLEIGPGRGVLTEELAKKAKQVIAVELDRTLVAALQKKFKNAKNVEIIHEDILRWWGEGAQFPTDSSSLRSASRRDALLHSDLARPPTVVGGLRARSVSYAAKEEPRYGNCLTDRGFKVVANIPYRITAPILRMFLEGMNRPALMVLMVQKEVAERVCAGPGQMSLLSVSVQYYAKPEIVRIVPRTAFDPAPKVDSAVLKIIPFMKKSHDTVFEKNFFQLVRLGFSSRRKQLQNLLATGFHISNEEAKKALHAVHLDSRVRAQELSVEAWTALTSYFFPV